MFPGVLLHKALWRRTRSWCRRGWRCPTASRCAGRAPGGSPARGCWQRALLPTLIFGGHHGRRGRDPCTHCLGASPMLTLPRAGTSSIHDTSIRVRGSSWFLWVVSSWRRPPGCCGSAWGHLAAPVPPARCGFRAALNLCSSLAPVSLPPSRRCWWQWGEGGTRGPLPALGTPPAMSGTAGEGSLSGPAVMGHGELGLPHPWGSQGRARDSRGWRRGRAHGEGSEPGEP